MHLNPNSAMVVFSGGQDSTTCLGWALEHFGRVECVSFDYNQKHIIELEAAKNVISFFERQTGRTITHDIVQISDNAFAGMSPLTNPGEQLETYADAEKMKAIIGDRVEKTFVPMRNAVFLMLAANRAVVAGAGNLVTGVCQADNANYPDCREDFVRESEATINWALGTEDAYSGPVFRGMTIQTPLMHRSKAETIQLALEMPHTFEALKWSHTAYDGLYPPTGKDHASTLRAQGFEHANVPDPLVLRAWAEGVMELPPTPNYEGAQEFLAGFVEPITGRSGF